MISNNVKALFICFLGLLTFQSDEYLDWIENQKLTWADFKAEPPAQSAHAALSNTGINFDLSMENGDFSVKVHARFNPQKSWKRKDIDSSDELLAHEQLHFDITELYARKLRKSMLDRKWKQNENINLIFGELYQNNQKALWAVQDIYDAQTEHSIHKEIQAKWNRAVADSLLMFRDYKNPEINFSIE